MTPSGTRVLPVTSARDGREHLVAEEAMVPGSAGRYVALCGHPVWAAVLACPAGPPCSACVAVREVHGSGGRGARRRHRRVTVLARVIARLRQPAAGPRRGRRA